MLVELDELFELLSALQQSVENTWRYAFLMTYN